MVTTKEKELLQVTFDSAEMNNNPIYSKENTAPKNALIRMFIAKVYDGDTVTGVQVTKSFNEADIFNGKEIKKGIYKFKLRLFGPDAPETAKGSKPAQSFADESTGFVAGMLLGKVVPVRIRGLDPYGRYLADIYMPQVGCDNLYFGCGLMLIRAGLAFVYRGTSADFDSEYFKRLVACEDVAREEKLKIWSQKHVVSPQEAKHPDIKFDEFGNIIE